jgi:hypothetical protein
MTSSLTLEVEHPEGLGAGNAVAFVAFNWRKSGYDFPGSPKRVGEICWGSQMGAKQTMRIVVTRSRVKIYVGEPKTTVLHAHLKGLPRKAGAGVNGTPGCPWLYL